MSVQAQSAVNQRDLFVSGNPQGAILALMYDDKILDRNKVNEISTNAKTQFLRLMRAKFEELNPGVDHESWEKYKTENKIKPKGRKAFCELFMLELSEGKRMTPEKVLKSGYIQDFTRTFQAPYACLNDVIPDYVNNVSAYFPQLKESNLYQENAGKMLCVYMTEKGLQKLADNFRIATTEQLAECRKIGEQLFGDLKSEKLLECDLDIVISSLKKQLDPAFEEKEIDFEKVTVERLDLIEKYISEYTIFYNGFKDEAKGKKFMTDYLSRMDIQMRAQLYAST